MKSVVTAILGGGQGTRLWPLTAVRAKPAVPLAGKFRLIDVPISNALHADLEQIYVLTQFNSVSLHRHIAQTYRFDAFSSGFVNILAAEQSFGSRDWYQGTADAVRQHLNEFSDSRPRDVLILSGDQLYLMDLTRFITQHRDNDADLSIAVNPVTAEEAPAFGVLRMDGDGWLTQFTEKPQDPALIADFALDAETIHRTGVDAEPGRLLASMGIYVFKTNVLRELLEEVAGDDFGRDIIPSAVDTKRVQGYVHAGYWRDIGTIKSFHESSIELTRQLPPLDLYDPDFPVYTHPRFLPGAKITDCKVFETIICDGAIVEGSEIARSIIGIRARVRSGTVIENSVVMGASDFGTADDSLPPGIGHGCTIRNAIIDLNARIGDGSKLLNSGEALEADGEGWAIRDGVVVVQRDAIIPAGTVI